MTTALQMPSLSNGTRKPVAQTCVCRVFVVFGKIGNSEAVKELSELNGTDGCRLNGIRFEGFAGSVGPGGEANDDGFSEVIVGAGAANPYGREDAGEAYLVFGQSSFAKPVLLEALDGSDGVRIAGERINHHLGRSANISGDLNGDGFVGMIIGARREAINGNDRSGSVYVIPDSPYEFGLYPTRSSFNLLESVT